MGTNLDPITPPPKNQIECCSPQNHENSSTTFSLTPLPERHETANMEWICMAFRASMSSLLAALVFTEFLVFSFYYIVKYCSKICGNCEFRLVTWNTVNSALVNVSKLALGRPSGKLNLQKNTTRLYKPHTERKLEVCIGNEISYFPFSRWAFRQNGDRRSVVPKREWEWEYYTRMEGMGIKKSFPQTMIHCSISVARSFATGCSLFLYLFVLVIVLNTRPTPLH